MQALVTVIVGQHIVHLVVVGDSAGGTVNVEDDRVFTRDILRNSGEADRGKDDDEKYEENSSCLHALYSYN